MFALLVIAFWMSNHLKLMKWIVKIIKIIIVYAYIRINKKNQLWNVNDCIVKYQYFIHNYSNIHWEWIKMYFKTIDAFIQLFYHSQTILCIIVSFRYGFCIVKRMKSQSKMRNYLWKKILKIITKNLNWILLKSHCIHHQKYIEAQEYIYFYVW